MKRQEKDIPPKEKCYLETEYPAYLILGMFYFLYNSIIKRYNYAVHLTRWKSGEHT